MQHSLEAAATAEQGNKVDEKPGVRPQLSEALLTADTQEEQHG